MMNLNSTLDLIDCSNYNIDIDTDRIALTDLADEPMDELALLELDYQGLI